MTRLFLFLLPVLFTIPGLWNSRLPDGPFIPIFWPCHKISPPDAKNISIKLQHIRLQRIINELPTLSSPEEIKIILSEIKIPFPKDPKTGSQLAIISKILNSINFRGNHEISNPSFSNQSTQNVRTP
jgi:hypothetical protein